MKIVAKPIKTIVVFEYDDKPPMPYKCKCQYKNDQKAENKNVHLPRAIPQPVLP